MIILAITCAAIAFGWIKKEKTPKSDSVRMQTFKIH
jgi:hypothetical protein